MNISALDGTLSAAGRLSLLPIGFGFEGDVTATHPDTVKMLARLGYVPAGPLGALDLRAHVKTDGQIHEVTAIDGTLGTTSVAGTAQVRTGGTKPTVVADLSTGVMDVQAFLAKGDKQAARKSLTGGRTAHAQSAANPLLVLAAFEALPVEVAQSARAVDPRWSREPFDLSVLNAFDGELSLKAEAIQFATYRLDRADIHATIKAGVMTADRVSGMLFDGPVSGRAVVRASGAPTIESTIQVQALDVARAVQAVAGKELATGKLGLNLDFAATGTSPAALVGSLAGAGDMAITALDVKQGGGGTVLAPVIGLVAAMNQFALPTGGGKTQEGLADLSLNFALKDGVAAIQNLVLNSAFGSGTGAGNVDIAGWAIDFTGNMTVEPNLLTALLSKGRLSTQEVPFSLSGRLDKPSVKLAVGPASGGAATPSVPVTPEDAIKGLLQQVLPGGLAPKKSAPSQQPAQPQDDGTLTPPPQQETSPSSGSSATPQKQLTPEEIFRQLMQGL